MFFNMKFKMFVKTTRKIYQVGKIDFENKRVYLENEDNYTQSYFHFDDVILIPFTGIYDREGNEVYNGDIIEYRVGRFVDMTLVKWGKVEFSFLKRTRISANKVGWKRGTYQGIPNYGKVIGNMYQNPELLEKELK